MARDPLRTAAKGKGSRPPAANGEHALLTWTVRPSLQRQRLPLLLVLAGAWYVFYVSLGFLGLLLAAGFSVALAAAFGLPTRYTLSRDGVRIETPLHREFRPWSDFAAYRELPAGVQLLFRKRTLGEGWLRGLLLHAPHGTAEVAAVVSRFLPLAGDGGAQSGGSPGSGDAARIPVRPLTAGELLREAGRNGRMPVGQRLETVAASRRE